MNSCNLNTAETGSNATNKIFQQLTLNDLPNTTKKLQHQPNEYSSQSITKIMTMHPKESLHYLNSKDPICSHCSTTHQKSNMAPHLTNKQILPLLLIFLSLLAPRTNSTKKTCIRHLKKIYIYKNTKTYGYINAKKHLIYYIYLWSILD